MGVIQGSINNLLNTTAIAARLAPGYETKQEAYKTKKEIKANKALGEARVEARRAEVQTARENGIRPNNITQDQLEAQTKELEKNAKLTEKLATLEPTKENVQSALDAKAVARTARTNYDLISKAMAEDKAAQAKANAEAVRAARANAKAKGEQAMQNADMAAEAKAESLIRMRKYQHKYGGKK